MKISAISNINFKQAAAPEKAANKEPKEENKNTGLSRNAKVAIGSGLIAAGLLTVYFVSRSPKAAKAAKKLYRMQRVQLRNKLKPQSKKVKMQLLK